MQSIYVNYLCSILRLASIQNRTVRVLKKVKYTDKSDRLQFQRNRITLNNQLEHATLRHIKFDEIPRQGACTNSKVCKIQKL